MTRQVPTSEVAIRVLLVDDDEDDYQLTRAMLADIPNVRFHLDWKSRFADGLDAARRGEHDVYLIDYRLGERTGLDLLRAMRECGCAGPVILLTGQGEREIDRAAEEAGAADYLEKSRLDAIILERMIRYALRQRAQEADLERKIAARTAELEAANAALREADRRKDEFLATMAHELRNPLAPIRNALEIQRMAAHDPDATEQARAIVERQVNQLVRLIDDLLDASRLSRDKLSLTEENLDLREPLAVAIEASRPLIDKSNLIFDHRACESPLPIRGDRVRLAQIFTNLLNNAAKFTEHGGRVTLTVARDDAHYRVTVADTGVGIAPEDLPRIFDLFIQIDRTVNRSDGGLGIGLALARRLVQMHGGSIQAESPGLGQGATFTVLLPVPVPDG